jgi:hypothetical protein
MDAGGIEMTHTKEPWRIDGPTVIGRFENEVEISGDHNFNVFVTSADKGDASRIVACVNACAGFSADELGEVAAHGGFVDQTRYNAKVTKQRDELLEALELLYRWANNWDSEFMNDPEWKNKDYPAIQTLVASVKGKE